MRSVIEYLSRNGCQVKIVHISYLRNMGKLYAFVTCIINKKKDWKEATKGYYWGEVSEHITTMIFAQLLRWDAGGIRSLNLQLMMTLSIRQLILQSILIP